MSEPNSPLINKLIQISKSDLARARILAERKKLDTELKNKREEVFKLKIELEQQEKILTQLKHSYRLEEKRVKEERDKLVERRKALASNNNYKLIEAAEREIESAARQIDAQEELQLGSLERLDAQEKLQQSLIKQLEKLQPELENLESDYAATVENLEQRDLVHLHEREEVAQDIDRAQLSVYERVRERHTLDPIVALKNDFTCSSCFMQLGPQIVVQISRGKELVKCRGCNRILYLTQE